MGFRDEEKRRGKEITRRQPHHTDFPEKKIGGQDERKFS